jgi:outer membrane autotransporter protein
MAGDLGYDIPVRNWILTPMLSVEYIRLATEDYTETGAGALNLTVAGQSTKLLQGHAGGSVAYVWKVGGATLTPRVWALYGHEFDADETAGVTARLAMGSASFTTAVASPGRDFVTLGGQALLTLPRDRSLYVNVSGQTGRSDYSAFNVGLGFRMAF